MVRMLLGMVLVIGMSHVALGENPVGVWRGKWSSGSTGHQGPMRVAIRPGANGTYQATFTGRFAVIIPFAYRATMVPTADAYGNLRLSSSKKLGPMMGNYTMSTAVIGNQLQGSFSAAGDRGTIRMNRDR